MDHVIPFAAISESANGIELGPKSELAHRVMLTNTLRLLGAIKRAKESRRITTRPAQVILPLSPNHGVFGGDGLYSESKLGLEGLLNKWSTEDWAEGDEVDVYEFITDNPQNVDRTGYIKRKVMGAFQEMWLNGEVAAAAGGEG